MLPDRVSNPGPLTYESGALPISLRGPAHGYEPPLRQGSFHKDLFSRKRGSTAHDLSLSSTHHPYMTEMLLKRA